MSKTLIETGYFFLGAVVGGSFNALLMSKKINEFGHYINYGIIFLFFLIAVLLAFEKFSDVELSPKKVFVLYGLLGWIVAGSWIAKYVK